MQRTADRLVKRGAKLLDKKLPGWFKHIKVGELEMDNGCKCVLGQLGTKKVNLDRLGWEMGGYADYGDMAFALLNVRDDVEYGFNCYDDEDSETMVNFAELQYSWENEIATRRKAYRENP